jgi:diguanylate cyclase (GGDEF)-like protein
MPRRFALCWCVVLLALPAIRLSAAPLIVGDEPLYGLGGHLELLRDLKGTESLSQVKDDEGWQATDADEPNPGFSRGVFWVRFQILSRTDNPLLLLYRFANVDFVDLFVIHQDGRLESLGSGDHVPFADRPIPHRYPLFPLDVSRGETVWCYVRVRNEAGTVFPLSVVSERAFLARDYQEQMIIGVFIGLFAIVILFNVLFFFATGDWSYLSYAAMVLFYLVFEFAYRGVGGEYIWPRRTWIDDQVTVSAAAASIVMGIVFTRGFLQTRTWAPRTHRLLSVVLFASLLNAVGTLLLPFRLTVRITNGLLLLLCVGLVPVAIVVLWRGFRAARFYLAAWVLMLAGGVIFAMYNFGMAASNVLTVNAMTFGAAAQVVMLSSAALDRILLLRRDRESMQRERVEAVEKRLYSDSLTELPNRNRLIADLQSGDPSTVVLVNIDHFKEINDYFGQKAGDYIIIELGKRIRSVISEQGGTVYRLHADEFAAVIGDSRGEGELDALGRALMAQCQDRPYLFENETLRLDVSVGIAMCTARHLEKADMALTVSRTRKSYTIYRPELEVIKKYADNLHWLHVIREAIEQDRIVPFFQPILNNRSGRIDKFESLMRIRASNGTIIPPGAFLTIAKKSKIYPELSRLIVGRTARLMRGVDAEVSVNISMEDIINPDVQAEIDRAVSEPDIGRRIVFELLESEGIENFEEVSRFIERMKSKGSKIAIDDFGSGYSNFAYILRLHVDYLKLDASLIKPIVEDGHARCIVETIVSFARKLGIQTIAEFVHNEPVQNIVQEIGVDFSQGYFIGEPRPDMLVSPR